MLPSDQGAISANTFTFISICMCVCVFVFVCVYVFVYLRKCVCFANVVRASQVKQGGQVAIGGDCLHSQIRGRPSLPCLAPHTTLIPDPRIAPIIITAQFHLTSKDNDTQEDKDKISCLPPTPLSILTNASRQS